MMKLQYEMDYEIMNWIELDWIGWICKLTFIIEGTDEMALKEWLFFIPLEIIQSDAFGCHDPTSEGL